MIYFFIHTPRTSGTTFIDILSRDSRNRIGYFYPPDKEMVDLEKRIKETPLYHLKHQPLWQQFNFIVGHFTFGIHGIIPVNDFKYIGVIREPLGHYISVLKAFIRMPADFQSKALPGRKILSINDSLEAGFAERARNIQTFFLSGLSRDEIARNREMAFETAVQNIERHFTGVYPTDRFDEGLIYFKHKIGIKPAYYRKINETGNNVMMGLTEHLADRIRQINDIDLRLYQYCSARFNKKTVEIRGFKREVRQFKIMNFCKGLSFHP